MKESVTAVFKCRVGDEDEYLLLKRAHHLKAFPGYTSFVGGKVDKADIEKKAVLADYDHINSSWLNAIVREVFEEVAFDLIEKREDIINITHLGTATTPSFQKVRFKNQYLLIELKDKFIPNNDEGEILDSYWMTLKQFLEEDFQALHMMVPPSRELLTRLELGKIDKCRDLNLNFKEDEVPEIEMLKGISILMPLSCTFPPANRTNCFYINGDVKFLVDPSPSGEQEYQYLLNSIGNRRIDFIFVTHHHIDHFENLNRIAIELNKPVKMSKETYKLIVKRTYEGYFNDVSVEFVKEGDCLGEWKNSKLIVWEVPGHASGQIAIIDTKNRINVVSDLIQSIGTVMVNPPNGNMKLYYKSLNRVINQNPYFIFPSHGLPLGGIHKIKKTLEHRLGREMHIKKLLEMGKSINDIYAIIYPFLSDDLKEFAIGTIEAHIQKIESES